MFFIYFYLGPLNVKGIVQTELFNLMQQQSLTKIRDRLNFLENYLLNSDTFVDDEVKKTQAQCLLIYVSVEK